MDSAEILNDLCRLILDARRECWCHMPSRHVAVCDPVDPDQLGAAPGVDRAVVYVTCGLHPLEVERAWIVECCRKVPSDPAWVGKLEILVMSA